MNAHAPIPIERHDDVTRAPSLLALGARVGVPFGVLLGCYSAIMAWLRTSRPGAAAFGWARTGAATAVVFTVAYAFALWAVARFRTHGGRVVSTAHASTFVVDCPAHEVLAAAARSLSVLQNPVRMVDLAHFVARAALETREPLIGRVRVNVEARVHPRGETGAELIVRSEPLIGRVDFGATRAAILAVARRFEDLCARGPWPDDARAITALPDGATSWVHAPGFVLGSVRSLEPETPALYLTMYDDQAAVFRVALLRVPMAIPAAEAVAMARVAKVRRYREVTTRDGFLVVPMDPMEEPRRVARALYREVVARHRGGAAPAGSLRPPSRRAPEPETKNERARRDDGAGPTKDERGGRRR